MTTNRDIAATFQAAADLFNEHDLVGHLQHPGIAGQIMLFVPTQDHLEAIARETSGKLYLPRYLGDHGHVRVGPIDFTWIPNHQTDLELENARLREQLAAVGA